MNKRLLFVLAVFVVGAAGVLVAIRPRPHRHPRVDMVAKLASFAQREGTWDNQWDKQKEKIADLQGALATEHDPRKRFTAEREIAAQALYAGDVETAISTLENLQRELGGFMPADAAEAIEADLAFAHLRRGETENCAEHHTAESCLFPIGREGVHRIRRGSERAVELYRQLLSRPSTTPENALSYRWLMNIGAMTLGQYPEGVPAQWLIPPGPSSPSSTSGASATWPRSRGLVEFGAAGGLILEDFDNDGHLDILISHMGIDDQLEYFHNDGDGTSARRPRRRD